MIRIILSLILIFPTILWAAQSNYLELGAAYFYQKNNLAVNDGNEIISNYSDPDKGYGEYIPVVRFNYSQNKDGTGFYIGSPALGLSRGGIQAGIKSNDFLKSDAIFYFSYSLPKEVWKNPYLLDTKRSSTYKDSYGLGFDFNNIADSGITYKLTINFEKVRDDKSGNIYEDLKRDGYIIHQELLKKINMTKNMFLNVGITYEKGVLEGEANSYDKPAIKVSWNYFNKHGYSTRLLYSLSYSEFSAKHPIFDKTRKNVEENLIAVLRKNNLFNFKNVFASVYCGLGGSFSNIDFYDKHFSFLGISTGYSF